MAGIFIDDLPVERAVVGGAFMPVRKEAKAQSLASTSQRPRLTHGHARDPFYLSQCHSTKMTLTVIKLSPFGLLRRSCCRWMELGVNAVEYVEKNCGAVDTRPLLGDEDGILPLYEFEYVACFALIPTLADTIPSEPLELD